VPDYEVRDAVHVFRARRGARELARKLGFDIRASEELAIAASELASNIVKYGVRGTLSVEPFFEGEVVAGVELSARDVGRPLANLELAVRDGYDDMGPLDPATLPRRGGLGAGLGAVARFTHSLTCEPEPGGGKRISARRYLRRPAQRPR
jgi:anti-sigma regulatory factor (Ser/Thr protein kinase)